MPSTKDKKSKSNLLKVDVSSGSDDDSEHELAYYSKDKVKLMKQVLKLIKPKKIKAMAPDCIKHLDVVEINSMLLEELLGISNKRLQYIFNGENVDRETSSSESEEEKQPIDVISLDDISDDDDIELCISQSEKDALESGSSKTNKHKPHKIKTESCDKIIKSENIEKSKKDTKKKLRKMKESNKEGNLKDSEKEKLMSVLELLELQARARAIKSQLAIESEKRNQSTENTKIKEELDSDSDAVIINSPQHKEIVITSDSEEESLQTHRTRFKQKADLLNIEIPLQKRQKIVVERSVKDEIKNKTYDRNNLDTIDLTDKITDSELKTRKEKLLSKIQKIKLIRNKNLMSVDVVKSNPNTCDDNNAILATFSTNSEILEKVGINEKQEDALNNSDSQKKSNFASDEVSENKKKENSEQNEDLNNSKQTTASTEKQTTNYCDNDEIVINLDEDEMDGMEND